MAKSALSSLAARRSRSSARDGRPRVDLGVGGDADGEPADCAGEVDQFLAVVQLPVDRVGVGGRVAAEREHVLEARGFEVDQDLDQFGARVRDADEMRHRG